MRYNNNKQHILTLIRNNSPIGRAQIAKLTGLSIPSVMKIIDGFIEMGLVQEVGKGESTGGKPPKLLKFVSGSHVSIGVDVGATNIHCILINAEDIIAKMSIPTHFEDGPQKVIQRIGDTIEHVMKESQTEISKLIGIGVAVPGLLDLATNRILFSPDIGWQNIDIVDTLHKRFQIPIFVENSTRATAFGEKIYGVAKEVSDYMCINLGYGIGGAMVFDNEVYAGFSGSAGEFGHMTVIPNGPLCDCGNKGCLEAVSSGRAILRDFREQIDSGEPTVLAKFKGENAHLLEVKTIYDAAKSGDPLATRIIMKSIEHIGIAIAGIINLLDVEMIILEGGISLNGSFLTDNLEKFINKHKMRYAGRFTKIVVSELGCNATAIGAASIVMDQLIKNGGDIYQLNGMELASGR